MNKRKLLTLAMTLCMVAILAVGGTLAYFTADDSAKNVFTVGNVKIDLTEPNWDDGEENDDGIENEVENVYPGEALPKDPTVENIGKNPCFVRVSVSNLNQFGEGKKIIFRTDYVDNKLGENWVDGGDGYFYYTKPLVVKGTEEESWNAGLVSKTDALFDQIVIPYGIENDAETKPIEVVAQAVQAQGAKAPNWAAVKDMTVDEIKAWFNTCGMNG